MKKSDAASSKIIFGIFAHPDDEAFGPAGTLIAEVEAGAQVHIITLTPGDAGENPDNHDDLAAVRLEEWKKAGELIGASAMHQLGYRDGRLNNDVLCDIADKIESIVRISLKTNHVTEVEFMTFELGGISGHIDHIVAARVACLVFYRLKAVDSRLKRIRLFCIPAEWAPHEDVHWIFMDHGYKPEEIDEVVDVTGSKARRADIIRAHHSQRGDGEMHLERILTAERFYNHFIVRE